MSSFLILESFNRLTSLSFGLLIQMLHNFHRSTFSPDPVSGKPFAADAILSNPPAFAHVHIAESLGIPLTISFSENSLSLAQRILTEPPIWSAISNALVSHNCISTPFGQYQTIQCGEGIDKLLVVCDGRDADLARVSGFQPRVPSHTYSYDFGRLGDVINNFRAQDLGLPALSMRSAPSVLDRLKVPHLYCWSPALIPKPADWMEHIGERYRHGG
jgi:sterol 3beta-glucosyltransferase